MEAAEATHTIHNHFVSILAGDILNYNLKVLKSLNTNLNFQALSVLGLHSTALSDWSQSTKNKHGP